MTDLKLYNTLGRKLEAFHPLHDKTVGLYTCGPTVYNTATIGNLRTYIYEDVLRRTLEFNDYTVKHVMNITDVGHLTGDGDMGEDKLEKASRETNRDAYTIAREYEQSFFSDLHKLNILPPSVTLRATETIDLQIDLIKKLEAKDVTYVISDGVYFDTSKFPRYGELSGQKSSEKKSGARVAINDEKRHSTDFALWKFSKPEDKRQMEWPSPWGVGFPGWHIECSAMSMKELGEQFDIHTGGIDHIAVHHENEIAQSEAATGKHPFVKYWLHGEFLVLPGKRMGKSEGNSITLQDVIDKGIHPLAFRYLCLQSHFRKQLSFTWEALTAASNGLARVWSLLSDVQAEPKVGCAEFEEKFVAALNDDLNTSSALAVMEELIKSDYPWAAKLQSLWVFDRVLGLDLNPESARQHITPNDPGDESLLAEYQAARREKRYADSDTIRKKFKEMNVTVEDLPDGTSRLRKK